MQIYILVYTFLGFTEKQGQTQRLGIQSSEPSELSEILAYNCLARTFKWLALKIPIGIQKIYRAIVYKSYTARWYTKTIP